MDDSVIDLCDSDDDANNATAGNKKFNDDVSDDSSSSSDDSHLWSAGGFLKGSPPRQKEVKRGNYFKEVRSKYDAIDDEKKKKKNIQKRTRNESQQHDAGADFGSPIVSLEMDDDMNDLDNMKEVEGESKLNNKKKDSTNTDNNNSHNNDDMSQQTKKRKLDKQSSNNNGAKKRLFSSSDDVPSNSKSPKKKKSPSKMQKEVECIEIDLSDDSDDDDEEEGSVEGKVLGATLMNGGKQQSKPSAVGKPSVMNGKHCDSDEEEDFDFEREFRMEKKQPITKKKMNDPSEMKQPAISKKRNSPIAMKRKTYDSDTDDNASYSSNSTVPLPEDKMSAEMKEYAKKLSPNQKRKKGSKGRVSFNNKDKVEFFDNDNEEDFGFDDGYGGFDEDDDPLTSNLNKKNKDVKTKSKTILKQKPRLTADVEVLEIDSDSDNNSTSSTELFTPRPFKKKEAKKQPAYKSDQQQSATMSNQKKSPNSNSSSSKLMTPRAFSPATTTPTQGAYSKRKVPVPSIPSMSAALIKEIGGKLYPDLRHNFVIALTSHARRLRHNAYQRAAFDSALRSVVVISLHLRPLRSAEAARRLKGVGSSFYDLLKESITGGAKGKKGFAPADGKYSCVAAAALVALLELEEANASVASANGKSFPLEDLIQKINQLLDARANASLNQIADKYLNADNLDPGFGQIKKLASTNAVAELGGPFIKERKKKDACPSGRVYELLDSGRNLAKRMRTLARSPIEPGPLRQLPDETVDEEFGNVTMSMDFREGGGGGKSLHKMCDHLDVRGVPYVVRELKIADYLFFAGDKLAPILIERKTAEDVASSLHDGRWERQQRAMRKAQFVLGAGAARRCQICYLIEGDASKKTVHGGNVGRRNWQQSVEDVDEAIAKLPSLGFSVMRSKAHLDTIGILAKVAQDVSWRARNGSIEAEFTYKQFLSRVKALPDHFGDPPTSREHQNPAPPVVVNSEHVPAPAADDGDRPQSDYNMQEGKAQSKQKAKPKPSSKQSSSQEGDSTEYAHLQKLPIAQLKEKCKDRDEKIGGKKDDLIARLMKPRKPEILILRARRNEYVPRVPSSNAALMVALLLHHVPATPGMTKERLMVLAEETGVSKESMSGDGGFYDGWSGMKQLQQGDPALVRREKGHRYSLTTQPPETSGRAIAHALHILAHREGICNCGTPPPE